MVTSLAIFFMHGALLDLKIASKSVIGNPSVLTIGVHYNSSGSIVIIGSARITELLAQKESWFNEDSSEQLHLFKQLFDKVMAEYRFTSHQIYFFAEGNCGLLAGEHLMPMVLDGMDYTKPGTAVLASGTPECCKFINYWRAYHRYPALELSEKFFSETNYYSVEELDAQKIKKLHSMLGDMLLNGLPPRIATFDKRLIGDCAKYLMEQHSVAACSTDPNKTANHKIDEYLLSSENVGDNRVYDFQVDSEEASGESVIEQLADFDKATTRSKPSLSVDSTDPSSSRTASISVTFRANQNQLFATDKPVIKHLDDKARRGFLFHSSVSPSPGEGYRLPQYDVTNASQLALNKGMVGDIKPVTQIKKSKGFKLFWCCGGTAAVVAPSSRSVPLQMGVQGDGGQNLERMASESKLGF